ncbi:uncharacterized protein LY89DRAFT_671401 [Mollisia scopiformis]|uniref:Uncharacterized protein n=1 Tax=Mollisia scopiformis TaxID=149040 RepID=A0A194X4L1_MOLSC|nr:uncharacterized protein LY89DRAFT_671401 [Mollisia scopiformis]KUJ15004.1 hypothetical protein LY89DRAFT_671401 [Mollisia scopiformis]
MADRHSQQIKTTPSMISFHEQQLTKELEHLHSRLEDHKVQTTIEQHPSFRQQKLDKDLVRQLLSRVEYVMMQVKSRHSWVGRTKRLFGAEEFDRKVGALETDTNKLFLKLGIE